MSLMKKNWQKIVAFLYFFVAPAISSADTNTPISSPGAGRIRNPLNNNITSFPAFLHSILEGFIKIGIIVVAISLVYTGLLFVMAQGNEEKLKKAKTSFGTTLLGGAVVLGSWAIAKLIENTVTALG